MFNSKKRNMTWIKQKSLHFYDVLSKKQLYQFAILMIVFLCTLSYFNSSLLRWILLACASVQVIGLFYHPLLRIEFTALSMVTYPIGTVLSFVFLAVVYFGVLSFIGLFKKKKYESSWIQSNKDIDLTKMYD